MTPIIRLGVAGTAIAGVLLVGSGTALAQTPSSGSIRVWGLAEVTGPTNKPSPVVVTGVIGDYGTTQSVNSSGVPDENGNYVKVTLRMGTFVVNITQLNQLFGSLQPTEFNSANCSAVFTAGPASVPIKSGSGTGSYKGISGTLSMTVNMAAIAPKTKSGSCNMSNSASPVAGWGTVTGSGSVSFG